MENINLKDYFLMIPASISQYKPIPFYFLNTINPADYTQERCDEAMRDLADKGFGGCILFNKPPTGFDAQEFMGNFWFSVIERFLIAGRKYHLEMWINDGFNYPPGDAAGRIEAVNKSLGQQRLRLNASGEAECVEMPWGYPAFELPESAELFAKFVYEPYYERLEKYFGNGLYGFFSDCDNRRINSENVNCLEDGRYFPWSRNFAEEFLGKYGYDILPHLSAVLKGCDSKVARDYWDLAGKLYQAWFASNHAWCQRHGVAYSFHTSDTGPLARYFSRRSSAFSEGSPLELLMQSDFPGTDHEIAVLDSGIHYDARYFLPEKCWGTPGRVEYPHFADTRHDVRAKLAASAAYMNNSSRCLCEMFAATNFGTDYQELRRIAMWQIMQGINFIVPHAVHHKFFGVIKHFAPPEFVHASLQDGVKEFNDYLARACRIASTGRYGASVALLDVTEEVWKGNRAASENFFALCDRLNRSACGFVVVTREYLSKHRQDFKLVIDPADWNGELDLSRLSGGDVRFTGGELSFMRRILPDETEILLAANVWSNSSLSGKLCWQKHEYELVLAPGEYAVLGGKDETYRSPENSMSVKTLSMLAECRLSAPHRIPLESWSAIDGGRHVFNWSNREFLGKLSLEIPMTFTGTVKCDGSELSEGKAFEFYADKYLRYELPASVQEPGEHSLVVTGLLPESETGYLAGNFETSLWCEGGDREKQIRTNYNLTVLAPKRFTLELAPVRSQFRTDDLLAEQGLNFYDGATVWQWVFTLEKHASAIDLAGTAGVCDLELDGMKIGRLIAEPYQLRYEIPAGKHQLTVTLHGSSGALFEGGNAKVQLGTVRLCFP